MSSMRNWNVISWGHGWSSVPFQCHVCNNICDIYSHLRLEPFEPVIEVQISSMSCSVCSVGVPLHVGVPINLVPMILYVQYMYLTCAMCYFSTVLPPMGVYYSILIFCTCPFYAFTPVSLS